MGSHRATPLTMLIRPSPGLHAGIWRGSTTSFPDIIINLDLTDDQELALLRRLRGRDDPVTFDFTKTRLVRIFNNGSFEEGGRFYGGWWQQYPGGLPYIIDHQWKTYSPIGLFRDALLDHVRPAGNGHPDGRPLCTGGLRCRSPWTHQEGFQHHHQLRHRSQAIGSIDGRIKNGKLSSELLSGERLIQAFIETHPLIRDKIASGEGVRGQFVDSQVAERILLRGIDIGLCILPIHDGFITTTGDEFVLERLMNDAFREITGCTAMLKPESFDLSVLPDDDMSMMDLIG